ncbi:MAG: PASTA domain-containing protein [Gemmatimonadota bacterium]
MKTLKAIGNLQVPRRWISLSVLVLALFGVGYLTAAEWLFPAATRGEEAPVVRVPDLVGLTAEQAEQLANRLHLEYVVRAGLAHPSAEEGSVLAQSPFPGQFTRPGAPVSVTLSRGPETHILPDVTGLAIRPGTITLERLGFRVRTEQVRDVAPGGRIVGMRPQPGEQLAVPAEVTILVSSGPPAMLVPDLLGRHVNDAADILRRAGLGLGRLISDPNALEAPGRITGQYPPSGYRLGRGKLVEVRVAGTRAEIERERETES